MKLDPDHTKNGRCENLMAQMRHKRREQYCRYCRRTLEKGKIDTYFDLFKHWQLLDEDDKKLLRLRLKKSSICQHCSDRINRIREDHDWDLIDFK